MREQRERKARVLVVDDDQRNVNILLELLEEFKVRVARNGLEALEALEDFECDIVLLDIMMPKMDGYEVCRRIKSDPRFCFIKTILVSGRAMLEERLEGYRAGADDYITKPFEAEELLAKLSVFLRLKTIEEVDSIENEFLTLLAHETRTPLHQIIGVAEAILDDASMTRDTIIEHVSLINKIGKDFHNLIEMVLLLCKLKVGRELELETVTAGQLIETVLSLTADQSKERNVEIEANIEDGTFSGDRELLSLALHNVLKSALNHARSGGKITLSTAREDGYYVMRIDGQFIYTEGELRHALMGFAAEDVDHHCNLGDVGLAVTKLIFQRHEGNFEVMTGLHCFSMKLPL